jgi:hypothetical protein
MGNDLVDNERGISQNICDWQKSDIFTAIFWRYGTVHFYHVNDYPISLRASAITQELILGTHKPA